METCKGRAAGFHIFIPVLIFALSCALSACSGGGGGGSSAPEIATASKLAAGSAGAHYFQPLAATGGTAPYTWTVTGGSLPPGINLSSSGILSGTAPDAGSFSFTAKATDSAGAAVTKTFDFTIGSELLMELLDDGSFEQGLAQWTVIGTNAGVQYSVVTDATHGSKALRVSSRTQAIDGPRQDVLSTLLANSSGTPLTTRFLIKLDAPAVARCVINLTSDLGNGQSATNKLILAEQVIITPNVWVEVSGTVPLGWSGTLTSANLNFEISQPAEKVYPAFTLDNIRVQRDGDSDGIPDVEETASDATTSDRDSDGLPDAWETRYFRAGLLDPNTADADLDADGDGFSNRQEFWAATDPLDPLTKPGVPSTAGANAKVLAITKYLALLPSLSTNRVVSGQHITGLPSYGGMAGEFNDNVQALFNKTGKWPGILSMQYEGADSSIGPIQANLVNPLAIDWAAKGGLVLIKFQPFDPWTLAVNSPSGDPHVDLVGLLNPAAGNPANLAANTLANSRWNDWLDQIATGLEQLQQAGVVVLWRPLSEMNNGSHWHSRQPREAWISLWRSMHSYLTITRGLKNLIWVYEGDAVAHLVVPADYYYPGDDVVDFMGHNLYDDDWALAYDLNAIFRRYPKIYGFPQAGSSNVRDGSWDNLILINGIKERFPRASLFCNWNDYYTGGNVFQSRSIVSQSNATALLNDSWVITRDEVQ